MALTPGTRLGPYEIVSALGAGGMGEVYRARDAKLNRDVALKILPDGFATDPERLARFRREAQVLASLNHPNIGHIYGFEDSGTTHALVMELVEGEDLAQRIARGAMPLDEALPIAKQIADALEAAHEQGIVHRDLKPANIKVRPDGTVKVLDFGLAKAMEPAAGSSPSMSMSPTITTPAMTQAGMILGTAAYMSPEQAKGRAVDKRADIWAFGAVLFEMLTGTRAFCGEDVQDTFVAIMRDEPAWALLPATLPPALDTYIRRCLHKDPRQRIHYIADVRLALEGAFETTAPQTTAFTRTAEPRGRLIWMTAFAVTALLAAVLAIPAVRHSRETSAPSSPEMRLQIVMPPGASLTSFALSPDGRRLVFQSQAKLWLRSLDSEAAQPLAGTEGTLPLPFWSPDSQSVGFFADSRLKRVDLSSGVVRTVADLPGFSGRGGTWNSAGTIVFAPSSDGSPLYRVSADGGEASPVTRLEPGHRTHRYPQFLPDGHHFIFFARTTDGQGIYLGSIDSFETRRVLDSDGSAVFAPPDYVLFGRKGTLLAQRFDLKDMTPQGNPISVAGQVATDWSTPNTSVTGSLAISASTTGLLAYRSSAGRAQLAWLDRAGREIGRVGDAGEYPRIRTQFSRDQSTLAIPRTDGGNTDIWLFDLKQGLPPRRFTTGAAWDGGSVWSPDGRQIVFSSSRKGVLDLYMKSVDASDEKPLLESAHGKTPGDWSSDGRFLLYQDADPKTADDLWALPMSGDRKPFVVVQTPSLECCGQFSPDGRWISYDSYETGRMEVFVQSFPGPAGRLRVSTNGAGNPSWRSDGRELLYQEPGGQVMAVPVTMEGTTLRTGTPVVLFQTSRAVVPSRDGQRFLTYSVIEEPSPITILLNWNRPTE